MERIADIAQALVEAGLDGWLFYDFRLSDPLAYRILGLPEHGLTTRRWFYFIQAKGPPQALVSAVEAHRLDALPASPRLVYRLELQMLQGLAGMLGNNNRVAMHNSPQSAIRYVSHCEGGTIGLIRALGVEI